MDQCPSSWRGNTPSQENHTWLLGPLVLEQALSIYGSKFFQVLVQVFVNQVTTNVLTYAKFMATGDHWQTMKIIYFQNLSQKPKDLTENEHKLIVVNCCLTGLCHNWCFRESLVDSTSKDAADNTLAQNQPQVFKRINRIEI